MNNETRCGAVAVVGAPNVGKSSLVNALAGRPVSSVTFKPQTTRSCVTGVISDERHQLILTDTPGMQTRQRSLLDRAMSRNAAKALADSDLALLLVDNRGWGREEDWLWESITQAAVPAFLCLTKVDLYPDKRALLPYIERLTADRAFTDVYPVSAKTGTNIAELRAALMARLPEGPFAFSAAVGQQDLQFVIAEEVRTQLLLKLGQEAPHSAYVEVEELRETDRILFVSAVIYLSKPSLKPIVVGKSGAMLKQIGIASRARLEERLGRKLMLKLWVRLDIDWTNKAATLSKLGISR